MKKFLFLLIALAFASSNVFAAFSVQEDGANKGIVEYLNASTGLDVAVSGNVATIVTSATAGAGAFTTLTSSSTTTLGDAAADVITILGTIAGASPLVFEGVTDDAFETTIAFGDPTVDQTLTVPATAGAAGSFALSGATVVITAGAAPTLTVPLAVNFIATDTIITDNQDQTITFSSGGSLGQVCTIVFQTDSGGANDEVITFQTTLTGTTGTLTLANLTANRYTIRLVSDGTIWNEVSRTGAQT